MPAGTSNVIRPVILCGGAGTRLWPLSRQQYPKQLLPIMGDRTLLQETATRLTGAHFAAPMVVSGEEQSFFIDRQLREAGVDAEVILLEPVGRNTAAAAALAAAWLKSHGHDELMLLMPSDHLIGDRNAFLRAIETGIPHAQGGAIVTFGAEPTEPNTQYGYIEAAIERPIGDGAFPIARFHEKPSRARAAEYLATGRFTWNCGIFLVKASALLDEMARLLPASLETIEDAVARATTEGVFVWPSMDAFSAAENISIDHGIMEKTAHGVVVPVHMEWSDVGAWDAVWRLSDKDASGNVTRGKVVAVDSSNSLIRNDGYSVVGAVGLEKMAVIAVADAIFVAPINRVSEVKELLARLKEDDPAAVTIPTKREHPWGSSETMAQEANFEVRHVTVAAGKEVMASVGHDTSLHWIVVRGEVEVTIGDDVRTVRQQESATAPAGAQHRLANNGDVAAELVEIRSRG